ncbi:MAG: DUF6691 family protein [Terricaulis sp.]
MAAVKIVIAAILGVVFGIGLLVSGMTDPANVLGFLDVAGAWNPALAFVMGGAVLVAAPAFAFAKRRGRALLGDALETPGRTKIDASLVIGAAIFGVGWGLAGICPGPGLVLLGRAPQAIWIFLGATAVGLLAAAGLERVSTPPTETAERRSP